VSAQDVRVESVSPRQDNDRIVVDYVLSNPTPNPVTVTTRATVAGPDPIASKEQTENVRGLPVGGTGRATEEFSASFGVSPSGGRTIKACVGFVQIANTRYEPGDAKGPAF